MLLYSEKFKNGWVNSAIYIIKNKIVEFIQTIHYFNFMRLTVGKL